METTLADNLKHVQQRIAAACSRSRRSVDSVRLVAVTKTAPLDMIRALIDLGVRDFGENRAPELIRRAAMLREASTDNAKDVTWHMIGHVQRNKVRMLLPWVSMIQSVDSLRLAEELDQCSAKLGSVTPILLEVNAGGETNKQGVAVAATTHLAEQIATLRNLKLRGLMCMAPLTKDSSVIRQAFERTRELFDEVVSQRTCGSAFRELSMGMSNDFEWGIEAGATMIRIGSLLFEGIELAPQPAETD